MNVNRKLVSLQEISKAQLSKILCTNHHSKCVVLESSLIRPLERVCGVKWLKGNGVEKIFKLESIAPNFGTGTVFYMIFGTMITFKQVVDQIRSKLDVENSVRNEFHIIVVPKVPNAFEDELEELGLHHTGIKLHSFQWQPIYLDTSILSLEVPQMYNKLFIQQDQVFLPVMTKVLWELFFVVGKPRLTVALGQHSNTILKQLDMLCEDRAGSDKLDSEFGSVIIMDRSLDYASALLTPGTYSALLNEVYGVRAGVCDFKETTTLDTDRKFNMVIKKQPVNFKLDGNQDKIYKDIRNRYFTEVTSVLSNLTKKLKEEKTTSKDMDLDEMKRYVQTQLQATKSRKKFITNHLMAAETIINVLGPRYETQQEIELNLMKNTSKNVNFAYLEELLSSSSDAYITLRLFCLMSITQGLSDVEIKSLWRKYLRQFGFKNGYAFRNLINAGFIPEHTSNAGYVPSLMRLPKLSISTGFYGSTSKLKQIPINPEKINLKFPTCASYVFGGSYIPLIVQVAGMLLNATPLDELKYKLEGIGPYTLVSDQGFPLQPRSVLIYLIGGMTYAEVAACELLETITGSKITVVSDRVISGNDLMCDVLKTPT